MKAGVDLTGRLWRPEPGGAGRSDRRRRSCCLRAFVTFVLIS